MKLIFSETSIIIPIGINISNMAANAANIVLRCTDQLLLTFIKV
jgi:hypothetical protein